MTERFIYFGEMLFKELNGSTPKFFIRQGNPSVFQNLEQILKDSSPDREQNPVIVKSIEIMQKSVIIQSLMLMRYLYQLIKYIKN